MREEFQILTFVEDGLLTGPVVRHSGALGSRSIVQSSATRLVGRSSIVRESRLLNGKKTDARDS